MTPRPLNRLIVAIKGGGEMASGVAWCLHMARIRKLFMLEVSSPLAVRRGVSFSEAIHEGRQTVEGVEAVKAAGKEEIEGAWRRGKIAVIEDPEWKTIAALSPDVVVDAILAKRNLGTSRQDAPLVIGLGPGFAAGEDVHRVIETNRGHDLGRIITTGSAEPNTGVPGSIGGQSGRRVQRAPEDGVFVSDRSIGEMILQGELFGAVGGAEVRSEIGGVIRGIIRPGTRVTAGAKIGDVDPRGERDFCNTISEKARAIGGAVLEAILSVYNR